MVVVVIEVYLVALALYLTSCCQWPSCPHLERLWPPVLLLLLLLLLLTRLLRVLRLLPLALSPRLRPRRPPACRRRRRNDHRQ